MRLVKRTVVGVRNAEDDTLQVLDVAIVVEVLRCHFECLIFGTRLIHKRRISASVMLRQRLFIFEF